MKAANTKLARRKVTVLAYLVADHKGLSRLLDPFATKEVRAIMDAADLTQMHVAVQIDYQRKKGVFRLSAGLEDFGTKALGSGGSRFKVVNPRRNREFRRILEQHKELKLRVEKGPESSASRARVLRQFVTWGRKQCPAEWYVLVFWGHSSGPMGLFYDSDPGAHQPQTLSLPELRKALGSLKGCIDIVLFRDCFMSTLETAYQLGGTARFVIGSQSQIPITGQWPYKDLFRGLLSAPDVPTAANALTQTLTTYYDDANNRGRFEDVPISLIDAGAVRAVTKSLKALVRELQAVRTDDELFRLSREAIDRSRRGDQALLDLRILCDNLRNIHREPLSSVAEELGRVVDEQLVLAHHSRIGDFRGISIFYNPIGSFIAPVMIPDRYSHLALSFATKWSRIALESM